MANRSPSGQSSKTDQILDLLLDALVERQAARRAQTARQSPPSPAPSQSETAAVKATATPAKTSQPAPPSKPAPQPRREPQPGDGDWQPPPRLPSIGMGRFISRLLLVLALVIVAVNIPVTRYGVSLARIMPDSASLIIRDGLILKGSGPEIYRLEEEKLRWISSMDAFSHLGLSWDDVHVVDDAFLDKFEKGGAIHVLLKCADSPHIYRLENDKKRWIKDIDTFLAEGHVWDDVRFVSCVYLRNLPDGLPIPENAGPAPQP